MLDCGGVIIAQLGCTAMVIALLNCGGMMVVSPGCT
jgi:hypothetical protein